jgi:hypothetical protein
MPPVAGRKSLTSRTVVPFSTARLCRLARQPYPRQFWSMALGGIAMCESGVHMARKHLEWSNSKNFSTTATWLGKCGQGSYFRLCPCFLAILKHIAFSNSSLKQAALPGSVSKDSRAANWCQLPDQELICSNVVTLNMQSLLRGCVFTTSHHLSIGIKSIAQRDIAQSRESSTRICAGSVPFFLEIRLAIGSLQLCLHFRSRHYKRLETTAFQLLLCCDKSGEGHIAQSQVRHAGSAVRARRPSEQGMERWRAGGCIQVSVLAL